MAEGKRLNKFISESGYTSRRGADKLIEEGKVLYNGEVAGLGIKVFKGDEVIVEGTKIGESTNEIYLAFNKPVGITCTTDLKDKTNIIDYINYPERIFPIGRLDKQSEGLIFLTNDGDIVNKILRAGNNHEKEYVVTVNKDITPEFIKKMGEGVDILDTTTLPCQIEKVTNRKFRIVLVQGLNRQIRRMCAVLGYEVKRLKRVRIMNVKLKGIEVGKWRNLTKKEILDINNMITDSSKTEEASKLKNE
jgi:23S rRNA pseudouridine2604 synthase